MLQCLAFMQGYPALTGLRELAGRGRPYVPLLAPTPRAEVSKASRGSARYYQLIDDIDTLCRFPAYPMTIWLDGPRTYVGRDR